MPNAQVSDVPVKFDLETCPEGYVTIKRFSYGGKLTRQENAVRNTASAEGKTTEFRVQLLQKETEFYTFAECIVDHNLTYTDSQTGDELPIDFKGRLWQQQLDPRIGEEISTHIDSLNNYEKLGEKN